MKIQFYWIGETKDKRLLSLEQEYLDRINRFIPAEIRKVPEQKKKDPRSRSAQLSKEGQKLLSLIPPGATVVVLDEKGDEPTSPKLAKWMEKATVSGVSAIAFVVGGYWGLPEEIKMKADKILALSRMTFPHETARILLLEQVYRAFAINNNLPYHK